MKYLNECDTEIQYVNPLSLVSLVEIYEQTQRTVGAHSEHSQNGNLQYLTWGMLLLLLCK